MNHTSAQTPSGLNEREAKARLARFGKNELSGQEGPSFWRTLAFRPDGADAASARGVRWAVSAFGRPRRSGAFVFVCRVGRRDYALARAAYRTSGGGAAQHAKSACPGGARRCFAEHCRQRGGAWGFAGAVRRRAGGGGRDLAQRSERGL
ncbi:MAG: cation-transporting P-type ATPase [Polyangia bacterium]